MNDAVLISTDQDRGDNTSASSAQADELCPGRHLMQRGLTSSSDASAAFGNALHSAFEGDEAALTSVTMESLLERALELEKKVLGRFKGEFTEYREIRLWATVGKLKHSGQVDRLFINQKDGIAIVEDLKSLRGEVEESSENKQLRDLAVLVWLNNPAIKEVVVFINQPMAGESTSFTRYKPEHLARAWAPIRLRIANSNDPNAKRVAGASQCLFCRARGCCPEAAVWELEQTRAVTSNKEEAKEIVKRLTPEAMVQVWSKRRTIIAILDGIDERLKQLPEAELAKQGIRVKEGFYREKLNDTATLLQRLSELGVVPDEVIKRMTISKSSLEGLLREATGTKGRELDFIVEKLLSGIVDRNQTSSQLVEVK